MNIKQKYVEKPQERIIPDMNMELKPKSIEDTCNHVKPKVESVAKESIGWKTWGGRNDWYNPESNRDNVLPRAKNWKK